MNSSSAEACRIDNLVAADRHHDRQDRHSGGQHPGQQRAQNDPGRMDLLRHALAQGRDGDRPQHPLGLQVADDRRCCGAQRGGDGDHRRRVAGDRPDRDDEDRPADQPVDRADDGPVERHLQRTRARLLGRDGVGVGEQSVAIAPLPTEHRHQQPQADERPKSEGQEQNCAEHGQIRLRQVLNHHPVLGWQAEPQKSEHEQRADDVGLQHAKREYRPRGTDHPSDECPDPPDRPGRTSHGSTVSVRG